ncbi:MAG: DNA-3-methyladenine glycosylase [Candidatus Aenigmarchaeota archaeon]|nr:DNA-3-methyladenine glycosylase [Candidatus Aenigmarchaeota archaeon]
MKLPRKFYSRRTDAVARDLLGSILVHQIGDKKLSGKIVETEAYFGKNDPGSHACRRMTPRNRIMFGKPGFAYVYFVYGNYYCLNFTTEKEGTAGAVLIRALEPIQGKDEMFRRRKKEDLTSGPGKLTQALGITREHNGLDLVGKNLYVLERKRPEKIVTTTRIGIKEGSELKLRFYIKENKFVSVC